jgi:hypothetical protein
MVFVLFGRCFHIQIQILFLVARERRLLDTEKSRGGGGGGERLPDLEQG